MNVDLNLRETAATLLGVSKRPGVQGSDSCDDSRAATTRVEEDTGTTSNESVNKTTALVSPPTQTSLAATTAATAALEAAQNGQPKNSNPSKMQTPASSGPGAFLSMTSIGFGIDSSASASFGDATEACVKALQDAMERSMLRLPVASTAGHDLRMIVQLGIPPKTQGSQETMDIDALKIHAALPHGVPTLPLDKAVGGLLIRGDPDGSPTICAVVASITLQSVPQTNQINTQGATPTRQASERLEQIASASQSEPQGPAATPILSSPPENQQRRNKGPLNRTNSIEVLAMISEEIRLSAEKRDNRQSSDDRNGAGNATAHLRPEDPFRALEAAGDDESNLKNGNYNYQKLPPGLTMKNNQRLFVKHSYRDHSTEQPLPEEQDLAAGTGKTLNAAFPLKLHETLTQIENDGHGDIIGWLPHGRSFKIHKQKDFAEIVLPRYFIMTKKSSFLRQLNLYGFNRFSAGPDQGSYYHEKFLRGMKYLCRRMTRQKVNGNRIRSAGNPDGEPVLSSYPSCPPQPNRLYST